MAKKTPQEIAAEKAVKLLAEEAKIRQEINSGLDGYLKKLQEAKDTQKSIVNTEKNIAELTKQIGVGNQLQQDTTNETLRLLNEQLIALRAQGDVLNKNLAEAKKMKMTFASMGVGLVKNFHKLPDLFQNSFGKIKSFGVFEMDKAIKTSALSMGLVGSRAKGLSDSIRETALTTNEWGMGVKELAELQSNYSEELGRTVMLGNAGLESMSAMAKATGLGVEGAAKLSAEMENQGLSAQRTSEYIEQTMNDATKLGLNASKVIKNIQNNMKMLNKYNFKGGVKGFEKMAATVSKLGVGMEFVSGMADKLFDIEGAVDMSAQLQVMGGEWSKLADPFKLMYMARNDMEGLTEAMGEAAKASTHFNAETGEFEISSLEMHKLRKIAEETGVSYDELATAGKNAAKFSKIKSQISFSMGTGKDAKEMKEFITSTAQLDEKGKAFVIDMHGDKKYLSELGAAGQTLIKSQMLEKATLAERAKAAQSFDEKITNLVNMVKTTLMPIADGLDEVLGPLIKDFFANKDFKTELKAVGVSIANFVKFGAGFVKVLGETVLALGPRGTLFAFVAGKALGWLVDKAMWIANGVLLSQGFMTGNAGGGFLQALKGLFTKQGPSSAVVPGVPGPAAATGMSALARGGMGLAGAGAGFGLGSLASSAAGHESTTAGNVAGFLGGAGGMALAAALAPETFGASLLLPLIGAGIGKFLGDATTQPTHDGLFSDIAGGLGSMAGGMFGSDFSKGRGIIQGGSITPIDNKDDLLAMKKGGVVDKAFNDKTNTPNIVKHEFGDLNITGSLVVTTPGGGNIGVDLLKNPEFVRGLSQKIQVDIQAMKNQVQKG